MNKDKIKFEIVGDNILILNDYRLAGPKCIGQSVTKEFEVRKQDLMNALGIKNVETKSAKEMFCGIDYFDYGNRNSESELYVFEKHITRGSNFEQDSLIITIDRSLDVEKTMGSSGKRIMFNPEEIQALNQLFKELEEE